jgi:DNA polymerase III epsilon subunit-like protein
MIMGMSSYFLPFSDQLKLCVIDLEWSNNMPIEVGLIVLHHEAGGWIEKTRYQSLINCLASPHAIDPEVIALTGITPTMLENAPPVAEVAQAIELFSRDCLMVAHGAQNDRVILEQFFERLEISYTRRWLCTFELAKREWPDLLSYELGALLQMFKLRGPEPLHRAMSDAQALVMLVDKLVHLSAPPQNEWVELFEKLPQLQSQSRELLLAAKPVPGLVSFYRQGRLVYIADLANLEMDGKKLLRSLDQEELEQIDDIQLCENEHELANLLLCEGLKRRFQPELNRRLDQRFVWGLYTYLDEQGLPRLKIRKLDGKKRTPLNIFTNKADAQVVIDKARPALTTLQQQWKGLEPTEQQRAVKSFFAKYNALNYPQRELLIGLKSAEHSWVEIRKGRLTRFSHLGKERTVSETLELRKKIVLKIHEIKGRKAHSLNFSQLKGRAYREAPAAGTLSTLAGAKTRVRGVDSSSASIL